MTKLGDMFHIPVTDRLNKRRPCVQKTIGRSGTVFCHFLLILVRPTGAPEGSKGGCMRFTISTADATCNATACS
jgi:hypothetical protein